MKGKTIGRYTVLDHLASGGMAEVFRARQESEGGFSKELVLKILQSRYAEMPGVVQMFLAEARIAAVLKHRNIVDVYDVGTDAGAYFIAMELIPGRTLTEILRRGMEVARPLSLAHAVHLVAETAAGLAHMQDGRDERGEPFGVIHRDISPSNLVIATSGQTKIIDFGIARQGQGEDLEGARPGKVSYMSPEQAQGRPLDGRSDIFSLGTILYEITLGRRLWRGPKAVVLRRIVEERPPPPTAVRRDYPPALELVVLRALEKRPEDRYQTAAEMQQDLERFLAEAGPVRDGDVARYVQELFSPDVPVSELGVRRARNFEDDEAPPSPDEDLDFDRPPAGAGQALAEALRAAGPLSASGPAPGGLAAGEVVGAPSSAIQSRRMAVLVLVLLGSAGAGAVISRLVGGQ